MLSINYNANIDGRLILYKGRLIIRFDLDKSNNYYSQLAVSDDADKCMWECKNASGYSSKQLIPNLPYTSLYPNIKSIALPFKATDYCRILVTMISVMDDYSSVSILVNGLYVYTYQFNGKARTANRYSVYLRPGETLSLICDPNVNIEAQLFY